MSSSDERFALIEFDGYSEEELLTANSLEEIARQLNAKTGRNGSRRDD